MNQTISARIQSNSRFIFVLLVATSSSVASAQDSGNTPAQPRTGGASPSGTPTATAAPSPAQLRANYALPWTMRPAIAPNLARIESSIGFRNDGIATATLFTVGETIIPTTVGYYLRLGAVNSQLTTNSPETNNVSAAAFCNPLLLLLYTPELTKGLRLSVAVATTVPLGTGGGNSPSALTASAIGTGIPTRSSMDNALFAVNYATPILGLGLAYMRWGFTFQLEATVLQLIRVRGENTRSGSDPMRTNFTGAASVGYLVHRLLTASAEFHYQHWLSAANLLHPTTGTPPAPNQASFELGIRSNLVLSRTVLFRPGISFGMGIGGAMGDKEYKILHFDVPITF